MDAYRERRAELETQSKEQGLSAGSTSTATATPKVNPWKLEKDSSGKERYVYTPTRSKADLLRDNPDMHPLTATQILSEEKYDSLKEIITPANFGQFPTEDAERALEKKLYEAHPDVYHSVTSVADGNVPHITTYLSDKDLAKTLGASVIGGDKVWVRSFENQSLDIEFGNKDYSLIFNHYDKTATARAGNKITSSIPVEKALRSVGISEDINELNKFSEGYALEAAIWGYDRRPESWKDGEYIGDREAKLVLINKNFQKKEYNLGKPSEGKVDAVRKSLTKTSYENTYHDGVKATEGMRNAQRTDMKDFDPSDKHVHRSKPSTIANLGRKANKLADEAWKKNGSFVSSVRHVRTGIIRPYVYNNYYIMTFSDGTKKEIKHRLNNDY